MIYMMNPVIEDMTISRIGRCVTKAKADYVYPPTELMYISSYLRKHGFGVDIIDGSLVENFDEVFNRIKNPEFFVIMVGIFSFKHDSKFIKLLKSKYPKVPVIVFGQGSTFLGEDYLDYADYSIYGEPENPILEIVKGKKNIIGVSYKAGNRKIINKVQNTVKNLDEIPHPARDLVNNEIYRHAFIRPYAMVYSSRGCPYLCVFCTSNGYSTSLRERSVENVIGELKELKEKYGITSFGFMDETFSLRKQRTIELCKRMIEEKLDMKWIALSRVDRVDAEALEWMKKAGCRIMMYGIEHSSQKVLDYMRKAFTVEQVVKAVKMTKDAGIEVHGFFILGSPPDNKELIEHTIKFAKDLKLNYASFNIYVPYPGTESFERLKKEGKILTEDWSKYDQSLNEFVFKHNSLTSEDIQQLIKKAYREFYLNPGFIARRFVRDIQEPKLFVRDIVNVRKIFANYMV